MRVDQAAILLIFTAWLWGMLALATNPVAIHVEGGPIKTEPAYVRLRVRVEPDPANRWLTVMIVSEGFGRSSVEQLEGDRSPRTRWIDYPDVPAGDYQAEAVVERQAASRSRDVAPLHVLPRVGR